MVSPVVTQQHAAPTAHPAEDLLDSAMKAFEAGDLIQARRLATRAKAERERSEAKS